MAGTFAPGGRAGKGGELRSGLSGSSFALHPGNWHQPYQPFTGRGPATRLEQAFKHLTFSWLPCADSGSYVNSLMILELGSWELLSLRFDRALTLAARLMLRCPRAGGSACSLGPSGGVVLAHSLGPR